MSHTPRKFYVSGLCEADNSYHIGTAGPLGCSGIQISESQSMDEVVADVWCSYEYAQEYANKFAAVDDLLEACEAALDLVDEGCTAHMQIARKLEAAIRLAKEGIG
jgi:hypothetical protein